MTLVTPWAIHQSADYRLAQLDSTGSERFVPISNHSAKIVVVQYFEWTAFISYCGIGMWEGRHTYHWLSHWLTHDLGEQQSFDQIVQKVESSGSAWLGEITKPLGKTPRHTFVVAAFVDGIARIALISNYASLDTPLPANTTDILNVSQASTRHSRLVITGIGRAISQKDRMFLRGFGKVRKDPEIVRHALAEVNARAANSKASQDGISPSCLAYSCLRDGSGAGESHGDVDGEMIPVLILNGSNVFETIKINPAPGRQVKMVGFSMATTRQDVCDPYEHCKPEILSGDSAHPRLANLVLTDQDLRDERYVRPISINNLGHVVGERFITRSGPPHAFLWTQETGMRELGTFGGHQSVANDINDTGVIVGCAQTLPHSNRAFLYKPDGEMIDLGTLGGRDSDAKAINNANQVIGSSYLTPGEPTQHEQRGFLWSEESGMTDLGSLGGSWSRAHDINDQGQVVGVSPVNGHLRAFLWTAENGLHDIGTLGGYSCEAIAINNRGTIVGYSETGTHSYVVFIWTADEGMVDLALGEGYRVSAINDLDEILLVRAVGARTHPFLWSRQTGLLALPRLREHHTEAEDMNRRGSMIGRSWRGDHRHSHALVWHVI